MRPLPSCMQSQRQSTGSPVLIIPWYSNSCNVALLDFTVQPSVFHFISYTVDKQADRKVNQLKPYHDAWLRLMVKISSTGMISLTQSWWRTGHHSRHWRSNHHTICCFSSKWGCQLMLRSCHIMFNNGWWGRWQLWGDCWCIVVIQEPGV